MTWQPEQYLKFAQPRLRPAIDLLARVTHDNPRRIYDLGCGTGNVTRFIKERWPDAAITGVDDSEEMLAQAATSIKGVTWLKQSLAVWRPEQPADITYSNAALHWLPQHDVLFPSLVNALAPGGILAAQMPRNFSAPSHTLIAETVRSGPWRSKLEHLLNPVPVATPQFYYDTLASRASNLDIWETEYLQVLEGVDPVKEWTKGTWLKQFLDALAGAERAEFEGAYAARLRVAYPMSDDGRTLFPFRRLFIVLRKCSS